MFNQQKNKENWTDYRKLDFRIKIWVGMTNRLLEEVEPCIDDMTISKKNRENVKILYERIYSALLQCHVIDKEIK